MPLESKLDAGIAVSRKERGKRNKRSGGFEARANEPVQKDDGQGPREASLIGSLQRGNPAKIQGSLAEARRCRYNA